MTEAWTEIMGLDPYELQLSLPAGEAVARWLKNRHPKDTAKMVARETGLDPRTVDNILDRHLSGPTLTKLLLAYRLDFGLTLIQAVLGESIEEAAQREIEEIAHARRALSTREAAVRGRHAALRAVRAVEPAGLRLVAQEGPSPSGERRSFAGGMGAGSAETSNDVAARRARARP